jgi:hypothetical protein
MCGCWLIHIFYCYFFGFLKEGKVLGKCMCTYFCSMDILHGSHSMHYNYSLLNISLYAGKYIYVCNPEVCAEYTHAHTHTHTYIYIYIYIYIYKHTHTHTQILSVHSIFRKPFLKLIVQYAHITKLSYFLYKFVM